MKCNECNKHKSVFKDLRTEKEICIWCAIKSRYKDDGLKVVLKVIKCHLKCEWYLKWRKRVKEGLVYTLGVTLTLYFLSLITLNIISFLNTKELFYILNALACAWIIHDLWRG